MAFEKKDGDGALWLKSGERGEYMTGEIFINGETVKLVCFPNDSQNPKAPAWRIQKSKPKELAMRGAHAHPCDYCQTPVECHGERCDTQWWCQGCSCADCGEPATDVFEDTDDASGYRGDLKLCTGCGDRRRQVSGEAQR